MLHSHKPARGTPIDRCATATPVHRLWEALRILNDRQIAHGDLRSQHITVDDGAVLFGSFGSAGTARPTPSFSPTSRSCW